jgi:hypothetical protein
MEEESTSSNDNKDDTANNNSKVSPNVAVTEAKNCGLPPGWTVKVIVSTVVSPCCPFYHHDLSIVVYTYSDNTHAFVSFQSIFFINLFFCFNTSPSLLILLIPT